MTGAGGLGEFLRARRELLDPDSLPLPSLNRRRTPGLRREEVAMLAGVSSHYYTRLEQGRNDNPSPAVLDAIARVLQLDEEAAAHMRALATARHLRDPRPEQVRPELARLMRRWSDEAVVLVGRYRDVLDANDVAQALNPGYTPGRNLVRDAFLDPTVREVYLDLDQIEERAVAGLRASAGTLEDDPRMAELVGELSARSPRFTELWSRHEVRQLPGGTKRFDHPRIGLLTASFESFEVTKNDRQTLYVYYPDDTPASRDGFALLASLAATDRSARPV